MMKAADLISSPVHTQPVTNFNAISFQPTVGIFMDLENFVCQILERGYSLAELVQNVKDIAGQMGNVRFIKAFADYDELRKLCRRNVQRELAESGVCTVYVAGKPGKNSADLAFAQEVLIATLRLQNDPEFIDCFFLLTGDGDLNLTCQTIVSRGRQLLVGAFRQSADRKLMERYPFQALDELFPRRNYNRRWNQASEGEFAGLLKITGFLKGKRWFFAQENVLEELLNPEGRQIIRELVSGGFLKPGPHPHTLELDRQHPDVYFAAWLIENLHYQLSIKGRDYVTTGFLTRGMQMDSALEEFEIGQTPAAAFRALERAAATGIVKCRRINHPNNRDSLETWWLE